MKKFLTFDCETDPFLFGRIPEPFIWGCYSEEFGYKVFYDTKDFVEFIKEWNGYAYAHNGGKFDTHFLIDYITDEQKKIMIIHGRIAKIKLGKCEIRDSYLNLPIPLSAYQKDEIDYSKFEKNVRKKHTEEIERYLQGDCKYLYNILKVNFNDYGQKLTLAGGAFNYWNKNFNKGKYPTKTNERFFIKFKPFYYGGRVECFQKGLINKNFKLYDINSAYPYAMMFEHIIGNEYLHTDKLYIDKITTGLFEVECISYGALPFRNKDNSLSFPNDNEKRIFKCSGWELKTGIKLNLIKELKIINAFYFVKSLNFKDYVNNFYELKKNAKINNNKENYTLSKLYLNSLYGKFGQNPDKFKNYILKNNDDLSSFTDENEKYSFLCQLNDTHSILEKDAEEFSKSWYNVATACSITGFVRAYMLEHLHRAKGLIYCDTDSIVCENLECEMHPENLGAWDLEGEFEKGAVAGKKMYAFKYINKNKYKISSKGARLNEKEIFKIAQGGIVKYKQDAPSFSLTKTTTFLEREIKMT